MFILICFLDTVKMENSSMEVNDDKTEENEDENKVDDDDDEDDDDETTNNIGTSPVSQTLSMTSFLFGNIDTKGQLEGDFFDPECKRQLASLSRLGLGSLLRQVTDDGEDDDEDDDEEEEQEDDDEGKG